jgi:hypothetical protein
MYGVAQNPVLEFLAIAAALGAAFVFVNDARGPLANASFFTRCAALLAATFVTVGVLDRILIFFSPMFNGVSTGVAGLEFLGGLVLVGMLVAAIMVLRGDLKIRLERPAAPGWMEPPAEYPTERPAPRTCAQCGATFKPDAVFCNNCGARIQALV